jgi:SAM-dependent methyltransferase
MHDQAMAWFTKHATTDPVTVLDIGGRNINGTPRHLFPNATVWTALDIREGDDVDIVADAATWIPDRTWDVVVCAETFEHTAAWRAIIRTAWTACKPGGRFIVTTAAPGRFPHSAVDGAGLRDGEHYANIRPGELERVLLDAGWVDVVVDVQQDPDDVRAVATKPRPAELAAHLTMTAEVMVTHADGSTE